VVALRVRALLERRKRREAELSGLFDTASDLAGLRDLDAVLHAIVHRARHLLETDIAYMTLTDEAAGDTYMRVTDGSISARFQRLRLALGTGLGGLVTQTGTPYATANYHEDQRFRHTHDIDEGVREEGLVAILGVPLRLGSRVIGVLYAANRSARPFAREEVALLVSLAAHAAVAIDTARLLGETQAALAELSAAHTKISAHSAAVERAAAAHDRMTSLVLRGGGVEDVAAAVADVLGGSLLVLDADGRILAKVGGLDAPDSPDIGEALSASRSEGRSVRRGDLWYAAVVAGAEKPWCPCASARARARHGCQGRCGPADPRTRRAGDRATPALPPNSGRRRRARARRVARRSDLAPDPRRGCPARSGPAAAGRPRPPARRWCASTIPPRPRALPGNARCRGRIRSRAPGRVWRPRATAASC
jgi:hypothetical protein